MFIERDKYIVFTYLLFYTPFLNLIFVKYSAYYESILSIYIPLLHCLEFVQVFVSIIFLPTHVDEDGKRRMFCFFAHFLILT